MSIITYNQRYYPHELSTRISSVQLYRSGKYSVREITEDIKYQKLP